MPILKSAKKKLRQDKKRAAQNATYKRQYKEALKTASESKTKKAVKKAYSLIDKAAKKGIIHDNKAARLKSQVAKLST